MRHEARHPHHYQGFAATQWKLFERTDELKPALYTLRVLLTGIHLMSTGQVQADLRHLWPGHGLPYVPELIEAKQCAEHGRLNGIVTPQALSADVERLRGELQEAFDSTHLPEAPDRAAVNSFVIETRRESAAYFG